MKVHNLPNIEQSLLNPHSAEIRDGSLNKPVVFRQALSELTAEQHQRYMTELSQKIHEQGQRLTKKADIKELQRYRELIGEFIRETVSNSYEFNKENSYESRRRNKVLATVNKINTKLEELAKDVLSAEADNLAILNKVDDIRGLILDMML